MENLTRKDVVDLIKRYRGPLAGSSAYLVAHQLDGLLHTVSGLTAGHFLKALSPTTFGFAAHGLGYGDVGAAPAFVSAAANLFWATPNGAPGVPSLRAIVAADIPALSYDASGAAAAAVNGTANTLAMFTATHVVGNSIVTQPTAIALTFTPTAANNLTINAAISDADHSLILQVANTEIFRLPGLSLGGGLLISGSNRLKLRDNYRYLETGGTEGLYINDATASGFINFVLGQRAAGPLQFSGDTTNFITDYQGGAAAWIFKVASSEISRISSAGQIMYGSLATYYRDTDTYIKSNSTGVFYYSAYTSHNFYLPSLGCGEVSASFKIDVDSSAPRIGILSTSTAYYTYLRCGVQGADITYVFPTAAPTVNYQYLSSTTAGVWSWRTAAQTLADIGAVAGTGTQYYLPMWNNAGGTTLGNSLIQQNSAGPFVGINCTGRTALDVNGSILTNWSESFIGTWYLDGSAFAMGQYFDVTNRVLLIYNKDADAADANPSIQFATGASQTTKMTITKSGLVGIGCAPTSMLRVAGPIALAAPQRLTTNYYNAAHPYVVAATDYALVFASTVPTAQYVTLPTGCTGRILSFQLIGTNNFNLIATNGSIIYRPGASSLTDELANPTTGHTCCVIEYDGTNWLMLSWG